MNGKILVVDDDAALNELIRDTLEFAGYATVPVFDGDRVIDAAVSEKPDLILLDLTLPNVRGEDLYRRIRQMPEISGIPVLLMTANIPRELLESGIRKEDVVSKPIDFKALKARISKLVSL
ncbi:MAG: response regulator [Elusimicrobia bacterium]|nr:response regulator [Elusimicrobiota bacterium]